MMKSTLLTSLLHSMIALATLLFISTSAFAQYVWLDDKGNKQFSDQPPPPSVPKNKILRLSGKLIDDTKTVTSADNPDKADSKQPNSLAEKEMEFKKRRDEAAAKEKKETDDAKLAASKKDNCRRMQAYKQTLDSGQRISDVDAKGNKSFISDEKRAQEQAQMTQNLTDCNTN